MSSGNPEASASSEDSVLRLNAQRAEETSTGRINKMELTGGVLRFTAGQSQADALQEEFNAAIPDQQRVYTGSLQYTAGNDRPTSTEPLRLTVTGSSGGRGGVLGTARSATGVATTRITDQCTVEIEPGNPATRTSARTAVNMGLLAIDAAGNYIETGTAAASAPPPASSSNENPTGGVLPGMSVGQPELFDQATEASVAQAISPVPQSVYEHAAVAAMIGGLDSVDWGNVASVSGLAPHDARSRGQTVYRAFESQAHQAAKSVGLSTEDVQGCFEWAASKHGDEFKAAMRHLVLARSTSQIQALARQYLRSSPPSIEGLRKQGRDAWTDKAGKEFVRINGHVMSTAAAARQGLI